MCRRLKYGLYVLLAGVSTGFFFFTRSLPVVRLYSEIGHDSSLFWAFPALSQLWGYIGIAVLIFLGFWCGYALVAARLTGTTFTQSLHADAYTYLPFCLLALALLQFSAFLTAQSDGVLLLPHSLGYFCLLLVGCGVAYLKFQNHAILLRRSGFPVLSSVTPTIQTLSWKVKLGILLLSFGIYVLVGLRITDQIELSGDEPHYLLITHSLFYDHDLAIKNNYQQRDYQAFYPHELDTHISLGKDGTQYSIHSIGLPILLLPAYAFTGAQGCVIFMNFMAALLALQLYLLVLSLLQRHRLALIIWAITSFAPPLLLYASAIYPEIPSALLLITAYRLIRAQSPKTLAQLILLGCTLAGLPWLHQRMVMPALLLSCDYVVTNFVPMIRHRQLSHRYSAALPLIMFALSGVMFMSYFYLLYGNPLPNAPHRSVGMTRVFSLKIFLREGGLGHLLDQEAGLLIYLPVMLFFLPGIVLFVQESAPQAIWLLLLILSVYIPSGGYVDGWRGAWSPVARYMVALIPFFLIPVCVSLRDATQRFYRYGLIILAGISVHWVYIHLNTPFFSIMSRVGVNAALEYYSSVVDLTRYLPTFPAVSMGQRVVLGVWLGLIVIFSVYVYRSARQGKQGHSVSPVPGYLQQPLTAHVKRVGGGLGMAVLLFVVVTGVIGQSYPDTPPPQLNSNRQVREFLAQLDYMTLISTHQLQQQAIPTTALRFEYLGEEKEGFINDHGPRFIVSGPHEPFSKGRYTAYFEVLALNTPAETAIVKFDIVTNHGRRIFNWKKVFGRDFPAAGKYVRFAVPFELREDVDALETRVFFYNLAEVCVRKIVIAPDLADAYYYAGVRALQHGREVVAHTLFRRALSVAPHLYASYALGVLEQRSGHWARSIDLLEPVVTSAPNFADAHYHLGVALQNTGEFAKARYHLERAVSLRTSYGDAWQALYRL